ncbi:hypothetical protein [Bacillus sp. T33-2]|uniref:hypothetical protein n=1 Tax=Bacillus sp. T33-2 TaxID=2054168 RepID=UPI000C78E0ED|nr:hypothetical protein [Bacillus sp. T33-2]PLR98487.1 hypothetical protein CVD19_05280 [Bacillus sp. T33-2]
MNKPSKEQLASQIKLIQIVKEDSKIKVVLGADNPQDLLSEETAQFAKDKAELKFNRPFHMAAVSDVTVRGQNELAYREYYFI